MKPTSATATTRRRRTSSLLLLAIALLLVLPAAGAFGQEYPLVEPEVEERVEVLPFREERPAPEAEVLGVQLPRTGFDSLALLLVATGMVAVGGGAVLYARKRQTVEVGRAS